MGFRPYTVIKLAILCTTLIILVRLLISPHGNHRKVPLGTVHRDFQEDRPPDIPEELWELAAMVGDPK